jgi:hypothetical protein
VNKIGLAVVLLLSMILVLYPSITSLFEIQNLIADYSIISSEALKARDNEILHVLGFISLYAFLGAILYYFDLPFNQKGKPRHSLDNDNQLTQQTKQAAIMGQINPQWSYVVGVLAFLALFLWQSVSIFQNPSELNFFNFLGYPIIADWVLGISFYFIVRFWNAQKKKQAFL